MNEMCSAVNTMFTTELSRVLMKKKVNNFNVRMRKWERERGNVYTPVADDEGDDQNDADCDDVDLV